MGLMGKNRSNLSRRRLASLTEVLSRLHNARIGTIDHMSIKQEGDGHWFNDNRGSNLYQDLEALIAVGTPYSDIGALQQEYITLTSNIDVTKEAPGFSSFVRELWQAEVVQAVGRPRANRRPLEKIVVYLVSDRSCSFLAQHYPDATFTETTAFSITPKAGTDGEYTKWRILEAARHIVEQGQKLTQNAVASLAQIAQPTISKISKTFGGWNKVKKILLLLIDSLYRGSNNLPDLDSEPKWLAYSYLPLLLVNNEVEEVEEVDVVEDMNNILESYGKSVFRKILAHLPRRTKVDLIAQILQSAFLPPGTVEFVMFSEALFQKGIQTTTP